MELTTEIVIDMRDKYVNTIVDAVQYDKNSRIIKATLLSGGSRFSIPTSATFRVNFKRADGASGSYTKLSDGSAAVVRSETNVLKIGIDELVTNASGKALISVSIIDGASEINTFSFIVNVQKAVTESSDLNKKYPDTYDGTATSSSIEEGKTAYSHGEKVTGTLEKAKQLSGSADSVSWNSLPGGITVKGKPHGKFIVDTDTSLSLTVDKELFGDASAADVAKGKTFTSASGLKAEGTLKEVKQGEELLTVAAKHATIEGANGLLMASAQFNPDSGSEGDRLVRSGAIVNSAVWLKDLGTARAEDVAKGKTFTSVSGLKVEGTHACEGGIDTSDATATSDDMATGKTAYVNGVKVTGRLPESKGLTVLGGETTFYVDSANNDGVAVAGVQNSDTIIRAGTSVKVVASYDKFGDAQASDVAKGKKFTSVAGLTVTGTHVCEGGIDTSDATATGADLAEGKTAYVNGEKISGTIKEVGAGGAIAAGAAAFSYVENADNGLIYANCEYNPAGNPGRDRIIRTGALVSIPVSASKFGDATAADVAKGKRFTSASGLMVTGTREGTGGVELPTLDNPGAAEDLILGKELIGADGIKVTGSLEMVSLDNTTFSLQTTNVEETEDTKGKCIQITFKNLPSRLAYEKGGSVRVKAKASKFGDATAADVAKGKRFTSASGLMVTGTREGTGGVELPTLDNPGAAEDLISGKELIGADGEKVVGTMFLAEEGMFLEGIATAEESAYQGEPVISISNPFAQRIAFDKGSGVKMHVLCENFGDASESDVVSGKTFTSKDGLTKPGSMPLITDTTGNIVMPTVDVLKSVSGGKNVIRNVIEMPERYAFEANSRFAADILYSVLPRAEPNLKAENIKKDVSIFDIVGTYEGSGGGDSGGSSGGLPDGIVSAMATGTYTPASDTSTPAGVEHNLGVVPNFCIWMADGDFTVETSTSATILGASLRKGLTSSNGSTYYVQYFVRGFNSTGGTAGTASQFAENAMTDTEVKLLCSSTYKLKAGLTYRWVCGVIDAFE